MKFSRSAVVCLVAYSSYNTPFGAASSGGPSGYSAAASYSSFNQYQQPQQQQNQQWYAQTQTSQPSYHPHQQQEQDDAAVSSSTTAADASENPTNSDDAELPPLPEGWSEHFDPSSGQYYYFNSADGTTTWDRPSPPEVEGDNVQVAPPSPETPPEGSGGSSMKDLQEFAGEEADRVSHDQQTDYQSYGTSTGSSTPPETENVQDLQGQDGGSWESRQPSAWGPPRVNRQPEQDQWGQPNLDPVSTELPQEEAKAEEDVQQQQQQQQQQPSGWGLPPHTDARPSQPAAWGVPSKPNQETQQAFLREQQQQQPPPLSREGPPGPVPSSTDQPPIDGRWGMPKTTGGRPPSPQEGRESPTPQNQSWQRQQQQQQNQQPEAPGSQQHRPIQSLRPPQQRPSSQQGPPMGQRPPQQQQQQQMPPQSYQSQYQQPPYGQYKPNAPPGYNMQYGQFAGQGGYYGGPPQQQQQQQSTGQLVTQGLEEGASVVKEALGKTWSSLLGFGSKTREAVEIAREQVVTSATAAGQTLSQKGSSFWEQAKSTVGSVFESNDPNSQQPYSLSGSTPGSSYPGNRPLSGYPGAGPQQPGRRPPPGYPGGPQQLGGRGPPPGYPGGPQQPGGSGPATGYPGPGRSGPPSGQNDIRYGGVPPGQQHQPPRTPQGNPPMQPRRDIPYPQTQQGQPRGPMQSQYGSQPGKPPQQGTGYPPRQQQAPPGQRRPPYPGPPPQQQQQQQQQQRDPWDHPGLMGDQ